MYELIYSIFNNFFVVMSIPIGVISYIYAKKQQHIVDSQGVVIAKINVRFVAYLIDSLILVLISSLIRYLLDLLDIIILNNSSFFYGVVLSLLYFPFLESSKMKASVGKKVMNIKVVTIECEQLSYSKANVRFFFSLISNFSLCVGNFVALFTKYNQTLHDVITKTMVIIDQGGDRRI